MSKNRKKRPVASATTGRKTAMIQRRRNTAALDRQKEKLIQQLYQAELLRLTLAGKHILKRDKVDLIIDAIEKVDAIARGGGL